MIYVYIILQMLRVACFRVSIVNCFLQYYEGKGMIRHSVIVGLDLIKYINMVPVGKTNH